jgi:hypothetical protein
LLWPTLCNGQRNHFGRQAHGLIAALGFGKSSSIMIPGAGIAVIGKDLAQTFGYTNVHVSDIDEGALKAQREFGVKNVHSLDMQFPCPKHAERYVSNGNRVPHPVCCLKLHEK